MGKTEHKTQIGLCSFFPNPETFMEATCSKNNLCHIMESSGVVGVAAFTGGGACRGVGVDVL